MRCRAITLLRSWGVLQTAGTLSQNYGQNLWLVVPLKMITRKMKQGVETCVGTMCGCELCVFQALRRWLLASATPKLRSPGSPNRRPGPAPNCGSTCHWHISNTRTPNAIVIVSHQLLLILAKLWHSFSTFEHTKRSCGPTTNPQHIPILV